MQRKRRLYTGAMTSFISFGRIVAQCHAVGWRTRAKRLSGFLGFGMVIGILSLPCFGQSASITVLALNQKNGKPLKNFVITLYDPDNRIRVGNGKYRDRLVASGHTDAHGAVVLKLSASHPKRVIVGIGGGPCGVVGQCSYG